MRATFCWPQREDPRPSIAMSGGRVSGALRSQRRSKPCTFENQYLNRTTAEAAVRMLERLDTGGLLPAERRKLVEEAMIASRTGSRRIRSVLPGDVVAGDKTGSSLRSAEGMTAADNDLAFVRLPDGTTYYMAVLVANSFEDDRTNEATIAGISRIVYDYFVERE